VKTQEEAAIQRVREEFKKCGTLPFCRDWTSEETMLAMEDGVSLRTLICRPVRQGAVPTIVMRTCYTENDPVYRVTAEEYCKRGFAYIYQYCRGTGGSEGEWEPNVNERKDGKTTIDWICAQDWVGNTGYFGCSYLALTGWTIADILPPKVKTMYLTHYGVHRFTSVYKDGLFRHDVLTAWSMGNAGTKIDADYLESCRYRPQEEVDEALWGVRLNWYREWITNTNRTDKYWNTGFWKMLKEIPKKVTIPLYIGEGWYDHHLGSAIETWLTLSEESRKKSCLLIGAWDHGYNIKLQDRTGSHFDNNDTVRAFEWFQKLLEEEAEPAGCVTYYVIGGDAWRTEKQFEVKDRKEARLYIGEQKCGKSFGLLPVNGACRGEADFLYDPDDPVMTHGAESLLATQDEQGSLLQQVPGYRNDVISCVSEPFENDMIIFGKINVNLSVSTDADDTSFAVKIMEVTEDGNAYNIRTGITTLGYRNNSDTRISYAPGEKVSVTIDTWDIAWKIKKGSRLRLDITSSDFPQYSIHTNYAGCWAKQKEVRTARQHIYFGGADQSYISLPYIADSNND